MATEFQPTRLYIKELAGVKYFGKTTLLDAHSYTGSGVIWKKRIEKYGKENIVTLWVSDWYHDPLPLTEFALKFSEDNQIVGSSEWANYIPENGLDGHSRASAKIVNGHPERRKQQSKSVTGTKNGRYDSTIYTFIHEDGKEVRGTRNELSTDHAVKNVHKLISGAYKSTGGWRLGDTLIEDVGKKGKNHPKFNHTVYDFIHESGIEELITCFDLAEKYSLVSGRLNAMVRGLHKSHRGWSLKK